MVELFFLEVFHFYFTKIIDKSLRRDEDSKLYYFSFVAQIFSRFLEYFFLFQILFTTFVDFRRKPELNKLFTEVRLVFVLKQQIQVEIWLMTLCLIWVLVKLGKECYMSAMHHRLQQQAHCPLPKWLQIKLKPSFLCDNKDFIVVIQFSSIRKMTLLLYAMCSMCMFIMSYFGL